MTEVNLPEVLAEVESAFAAYERALCGNDLEALSALFWRSPLTLRYGVEGTQCGHEAIAEFRRRRGAVDQRRTLRNTRITTFGREFAVANSEFLRAGAERVGRQSQTWIRTEEGWKIVSAHVSFEVS